MLDFSLYMKQLFGKNVKYLIVYVISFNRLRLGFRAGSL